MRELLDEDNHAPLIGSAFRQVLEATLNVLPDPVFVKNDAHQWVVVNDAFCRFLGRSREWLSGKTDIDYSSPEEAAVFWKKDDEVFATGEANISLETHTDAAGIKRTIETKKSVLMGPDGTRFLIGVARDLTEITRAQEQLEQSNRELERIVEQRTRELRMSHAQLENIAFFDALTGLPNRRLLIERLDALASARSIGVLFLDIDDFKRMNDARGHQFGDQILSVVARRLREIEGLHFVARLGGDEFVLIVDNADTLQDEGLTEIAVRVRETLSRTLMVQGHELALTASVGIAVSPRDGSSAAELIQHADTAMYRAKHCGRDQHAFFDSQLAMYAREYSDVETALRSAIRLHKLGVALQPIFDSRTRAIVGYEALARWNDPVLGEISPERFVPISEYSGMVYELGLSVMESAFQLAPAFLDKAQTGARLAVNLSGRQLARRGFVRDLKILLDRTGFPAQRLEFEITESSVTHMSTETQENLAGLRAMRISLALDDFGTGFSSLTHLQRLAIDRVKIDRGFIAEIPDNRRTSTLVEAIVRMGQAMGLKVVAEGVERVEQMDFLARVGCDEVQGFLLGRPVLASRSPRGKES